MSARSLSGLPILSLFPPFKPPGSAPDPEMLLLPISFFHNFFFPPWSPNPPISNFFGFSVDLFHFPLHAFNLTPPPPQEPSFLKNAPQPPPTSNTVTPQDSSLKPHKVPTFSSNPHSPSPAIPHLFFVPVESPLSFPRKTDVTIILFLPPPPGMFFVLDKLYPFFRHSFSTSPFGSPP